MLAEKMIHKSENLIKTNRTKIVDKLQHIEKLSAEEMVQFLSDLLFKLVLFLGVPYFIVVFIQFIIK